MKPANMLTDIEKNLDSFDLSVRSKAVADLSSIIKSGKVSLPPAGTDVNLHFHSFFSFNYRGFSPSKIAWLSKQYGLEAAGIVDFDVLDGLDEFYAAAAILNLKAVVGIETRVFIPEFADKEINSPGEPGISYHMGVGFTSLKLSQSALKFLERLKSIAQNRNIQLIKLVNQFLSLAEIDYKNDVLSLAPSGNPTERHICLAYAQKARNIFKDDNDLKKFWSEKLSTSLDAIKDLPDGPALTNLIRAKTMKQGGVGYVKPQTDTFPTMAEVNKFAIECGAIPTHAWLNGFSDGEKEIKKLLEVSIAAGSAAINIIPDRNFTPSVKDQKLQNLYDVVELAQKMDLPVFVGTEMNTPGHKFVDDFKSKELSPLVPAFLKGAHIAYGHTLMQRNCELGYTSDWGKNNFKTIKEKNNFFEKIGKSLNPNSENILKKFNNIFTPDQILKAIEK